MQSLEEIKRANNPPHPSLNERLRHAHVRNFGIAISDEDVHLIVGLLDAAEELQLQDAADETASDRINTVQQAMRRIRGR